MQPLSALKHRLPVFGEFPPPGGRFLGMSMGQVVCDPDRFLFLGRDRHIVKDDPTQGAGEGLIGLPHCFNPSSIRFNPSSIRGGGRFGCPAVAETLVCGLLADVQDGGDLRP